MTTTSERHVAVVSKVDDPEKRGRVKVICPSILGDDVTELPMWVEPVLDWGLFAIPEIGEIIEIETTASSSTDEVLGQESIRRMEPRWRGNRFFDTKNTLPVATINPDFTDEHYGKKRGFQSKRHTLVFDDTEGDESITVSWRDKNGKLNQFFLTSTNFAVALDVGGEESGLTLNLSGSGAAAQMILGSGVATVPIGEHLAEAWDEMVAQQTAFNAAVQAAVVGAVAIASAPDAGIAAAAAGAAPALTALAAANPNLPAYDVASINSDHVSIPDNEP